MLMEICAGLIAALLGVFLASGWYASHRSLKEAQEANQTLSGRIRELNRMRDVEQATAEVYLAQMMLLKRQQKETDEALRKALVKESVWADGMVPSSVADALRVQLPPAGN